MPIERINDYRPRDLSQPGAPRTVISLRDHPGVFKVESWTPDTWVTGFAVLGFEKAGTTLTREAAPTDFVFDEHNLDRLHFDREAGINFLTQFGKQPVEIGESGEPVPAKPRFFVEYEPVEDADGIVEYRPVRSGLIAFPRTLMSHQKTTFWELIQITNQDVR